MRGTSRLCLLGKFCFAKRDPLRRSDKENPDFLYSRSLGKFRKRNAPLPHSEKENIFSFSSFVGDSPSGKAPGSGPGIRGFESLIPSQRKYFRFGGRIFLVFLGEISGDDG